MKSSSNVNNVRKHSSERDLNRHASVHEKHFKFQYAQCGRRFELEDDKEAHRSRCKRKRYMCDICQQSTKSKSRLIEHIRKHTGEKPFQCLQCPKRFTRKDTMNDFTLCAVKKSQ